ncbi:MAG: hypothetical protein RLZZ292_1544 [Bacteroidota bacterium]|jgi:hypothetical protein
MIAIKMKDSTINTPHQGKPTQLDGLSEEEK